MKTLSEEMTMKMNEITQWEVYNYIGEVIIYPTGILRIPVE